MSSSLDFTLALLLVLIIGALLWLDQARLLAMVARPPRTGEPGAAQTSYYWKLTRQCGLPPYETWPFYIGAKLVLAVLLAVLALRVGLGRWALLCLPLGFMIPDLILMSVRRNRQTTIRKALSFFLDLLVSLLQAGLGLEEAFARVAREGLPPGHPLANEALRVVEELSLGRDRSLGFQLLADRTGVVELRSVANALSVGLTLGGSVETTLKAQAELVRAKRREDGLKRLNIASAQVLLPLMLCGFPVFAVLVFAPLAMRVMQSLADLGSILRVR